ncbi:hypothetical protein IJH97_01220 [Candidatus Saccharibacteria bacterium]|nr:hypothetical protein [Candidatus Saccharibacteria bacterium]
MSKAKITWQAEEYVTQDKNGGWYAGLVAVGLSLTGLSIWLQWWSFTVLIILSVVALILYSVRPPRKIDYAIVEDGLKEGVKLYKFEDYKSFGVLQDGNRFAIVLTPKKRFRPAVMVYFPESNGEEIVDGFGMRLPMAEVKLDFLDKLVRILRI